GASTGIGAAVAKAFAAHGAKVAIHFNNSAEKAREVADAIAQKGGKAELLQGNLQSRGEAKRIVEAAAGALGGLDVLVNNAGSLVRRSPFDQIDDQLIDEVFDLNVRSVIAASQ